MKKLKKYYIKSIILFNRFIKYLEFIENERLKCMIFTGQGKV